MEVPVWLRKRIKPLREARSVLIVTHHDADGVSSAGSLSRGLLSLGKEVDIVVLRQFYPDQVEKVPYSDHDSVVFTDLAGRYLQEISNYLDSFLVIDHHDQTDLNDQHLVHPLLLGLNPDVDASASTLSALVSHLLSPDEKTLAYGLVGAAGDRQFEGGRFKGLNRTFVTEALKSGVLTVYRDLTLPGLSSKLLPEVFLYSTDPVLPGLTGNAEGVYDLLERAGIVSLYPSGRIRYSELGLEEKRRLFTALHLHLLRQGWSPSDTLSLIGEVYELNGNYGYKSTVRSFAVLSNAVGKNLREDLIVPLYTDEVGVLDEAESVLSEYLRTLYRAVVHGREHYKDEGVLVWADLRSSFPPYVSGAVAEALSSEGRVGMCVVEDEGGYVKVSLRGGRRLSAIVSAAAEKVGGEGGGHDRAAGARIPEEKLEEFISLLLKELQSLL